MYERLLAQKPAAANYGSSGSNKKRTGLPKVEYNKLVNLSLTNFDEYKISIYNLGYSRKWPECFSQPSAKDLTIEWDGSDNEDGDVRREAFLVLYNTIPLELKYMVRQARSGDVMGIWSVLYDRFLHVTSDQVKTMVNEWNMLSMDTSGLTVDKFVSLIAQKSQALKLVGEEKQDKDDAAAFIKSNSALGA